MSFNILLFWSSPKDREDLRLVDEQNLIEAFVNKNNSNEFEFNARGGARVSDLWEMVKDTKPKLVHISGHGTEENEVCFEDNEGYEEKVNIHNIIEYLNDIGTIECLILNSCFSSKNIEEDRINFAFLIGMSKEIPNDTAHLFSNSFYSALLKEKSIRHAFKLALGRIKLSNIEESKIPKLIERHGIESLDIENTSGGQDLISVGEIESLKKYVKQYWFPLLVFSVSTFTSICCITFLDSNDYGDKTNVIVGAIVLVIGIIWSFLMLKKIQRTLQKIEVLEIKRDRYLKAIKKLKQDDIKELNNDFYKLM